MKTLLENSSTDSIRGSEPNIKPYLKSLPCYGIYVCMYVQRYRFVEYIYNVRVDVLIAPLEKCPRMHARRVAILNNL